MNKGYVTLTKRLLRVFCVAVLTLVVVGCQVSQLNHFGPQSHFTYPNSNVAPLGPVKLKTNGPVGLSPQMPNSDSDAALYNAALVQVDGASLIIDYRRTYKLYLLPLLFLPIYWSTLELEGTAAKMDVVKQELK